MFEFIIDEFSLLFGSHIAQFKKGEKLSKLEILERCDIHIKDLEDMEARFSYMYNCCGIAKATKVIEEIEPSDVLELQNEETEPSDLVKVDRMFVCEEDIISKNEIIFAKEQKVSETELKQKLGNLRLGKLLKEEKILEIKIIGDSNA